MVTQRIPEHMLQIIQEVVGFTVSLVSQHIRGAVWFLAVDLLDYGLGVVYDSRN